MPDKGVSTDKLSVGLSKVDERVEATKVEVSLAGLDGVPFYGQKRISGALSCSKI